MLNIRETVKTGNNKCENDKVLVILFSFTFNPVKHVVIQLVSSPHYLASYERTFERWR